MANNQASQTIGFVFGPGLQAAFAYIGCSALARSGKTYFTLDAYTACGWTVGIGGIICVILFLPGIFEEHNVSVVEMESYNEEIKPDIVPLVVLLIAGFVFVFNFSFVTA